MLTQLASSRHALHTLIVPPHLLLLQAATCDDGVKNGDETVRHSAACLLPSAACYIGKHTGPQWGGAPILFSACRSQDVDCGGQDCASNKCANGKACVAAGDCSSGVCSGGSCQVGGELVGLEVGLQYPFLSDRAEAHAVLLQRR